ncbi:Transcriptional regulator, ArsR family [hydrothermal vent metagenome]|uniref:Transcriptional regulator, ArsR family n=1 Tax=hydrothermal vent metagenome TaxID=652676 RepID=A0A3B1CUB8_9ZZZZ
MKRQKDTCGIRLTDSAAVEHVAKRISGERELAGMAEMFKALAEPTRIKIIEALSLRELCVCDLSVVLGMSQSATSHQLRFLRHLGLVRFRKAGKICYYSLDDDHVSELLSAVREHNLHKQEK